MLKKTIFIRIDLILEKDIRFFLQNVIRIGDIKLEFVVVDIILSNELNLYVLVDCSLDCLEKIVMTWFF